MVWQFGQQYAITIFKEASGVIISKYEVESQDNCHKVNNLYQLFTGFQSGSPEFICS